MTFSQTLRHWFIPHHTNNHRAKALHIDALSLYLLFFLVFTFATRTIHRAAPEVLGYATDIYVDRLLADTNAERSKLGLGTLELNQQLSQAAAAKAQNMFAENYWAHNSPSGKTPWYFINNSGYRYAIAGENLAKNFQSSQGVVDAWMASPSHRDNIVKSGYRDVGFAVVNGTLNGEETTLVVQMFGSSAFATTARESQPIAQARSVVAAQPEPTAVSVFPTVTSTPGPPGQPVTAFMGNLTVSPTPAGPEPEVAGNIRSARSGIMIRPFINLSSLNRTLVYIFIGGMLALLAVDAAVIGRKRIVRVSGHPVGHFLFFTVVLLITVWTTGGSIV